ncbi:ATP-dependent DNA helicase PIF1-like [Neltuma alba]|uniref:ATP-dependent DNA helicase PIF1-like n=1 Tax=Neltuma alba TaxID=207710 RepID=UPI0010A3F06C|nr:ATP-dependent DNA helicase PIF1-like [Prosopis alba]
MEIMASSGIAAALLPSRRTAHSRFCIPIEINEDSICSIINHSLLANLIKTTKLIICDEALMVRKFCIEASNHSLKDILRCNRTFGGKTVVMGGDLTNVSSNTKGGRVDIVNSAINSSSLWTKCTLLHLTKNMRLLSHSNIDESLRIKSFSEWLLKIGEGRIGYDISGMTWIDLPENLIIQQVIDPIKAIVDATYPYLIHNIFDSEYISNRAILAPTMKIVKTLNDYVLSHVHREEVEYYNSNSINKTQKEDTTQHDIYTIEFLNTITYSGIPPHVLTLKVGVLIMLLRNIDQSTGLCNGMRPRITLLGGHFIKAVALNRTIKDEEVLIHRMDLNPSQSRLPFSMTRRQFSVMVLFAMTINKSQGQLMERVGLYLSTPVFSHGQLYVALSRVKSIDGLKILVLDAEKKPTNQTINVVYDEIF